MRAAFDGHAAVVQFLLPGGHVVGVDGEAHVNPAVGIVRWDFAAAQVFGFKGRPAFKQQKRVEVADVKRDQHIAFDHDLQMKGLVVKIFCCCKIFHVKSGFNYPFELKHGALRIGKVIPDL